MTNVRSGDLDAIEDRARDAGPEAACAELRARLEVCDQLPELYDALLLHDRFQRGLPLLGKLDLDAFAGELRAALEEALRDACRTVGERFLARGDLVGAWPYYQNIGESAPMVDALATWSAREGDDRNLPEVVVKIAFAQGASPLRGYELLLEHFGTCEGISVLERGFPFGPHLRRECSRRLIRHFHRELCEGVMRLLHPEAPAVPHQDPPAPHQDPPAPPEEPPAPPEVWPHTADAPTLTTLVEQHRARIAGEHCPVDDSHLQAVVRCAALLDSCEELSLAAELAHYGMCLAPSFQHRETAPFENFYRDYRLLLRGLAQEDVAAAVEHFTRKVGGPDPAPFAVEILVLLLHRTGRAEAALQWSRQFLRDAPRALGAAPTYPELCLAAGATDELAAYARRKGDLLLFTAACVARAPRAQGD